MSEEDKEAAEKEWDEAMDEVNEKAGRRRMQKEVREKITLQMNRPSLLEVLEAS